jgi:hypothetical protein
VNSRLPLAAPAPSPSARRLCTALYRRAAGMTTRPLPSPPNDNRIVGGPRKPHLDFITRKDFITLKEFITLKDFITLRDIITLMDFITLSDFITLEDFITYRILLLLWILLPIGFYYSCGFYYLLLCFRSLVAVCVIATPPGSPETCLTSRLYC